MGQKVNPVGLRIGVIKDWDAKWYANKNDVPTLLLEDIKIREFLNEFYKNAFTSKIEIEKTKDKIKIIIHTAKPGMVLGRDAETKKEAIEKIKRIVKKINNNTKKEITIDVVEIKNPDIDAKLVAESIALQLENRASFRRVQKMAIQRAMKSRVKGIKTLVSGRLGGAEMARSEGYSEGNVPLHTLRADIDYALAEANTTYGKLGVKVWICKGEILPKTKKEGGE